jgi:hypothetical protein
MANTDLLNTTAADQLPVEVEKVVASDADVTVCDTNSIAHDTDVVAQISQQLDLYDYLSNGPAAVASIKQVVPPQQALDLC